MSSSKPYALIGLTISPLFDDGKPNDRKSMLLTGQDMLVPEWTKTKFIQVTQEKQTGVRGQLELGTLVNTKVMLIFPLLTSSKKGE